MKRNPIQITGLVAGMMFSAASSFAANNFMELELNSEVINKTSLTIPVTTETHGHTKMVVAPTSLSTGTNLFISEAPLTTELRFTLKIGDPSNPKGQCTVTMYTLFGEELKQGDGSSNFQCYLMSNSLHKKKVYIIPYP